MKKTTLGEFLVDQNNVHITYSTNVGLLSSTVGLNVDAAPRLIGDKLYVGDNMIASAGLEGEILESGMVSAYMGDGSKLVTDLVRFQLDAHTYLSITRTRKE